MADDRSPPEDRMEAAASYFIALGGRMHHMAEQVRQLAADRDNALTELCDAEIARDNALDRAQELESSINDMRLGIRAPQEIIERHFSYPAYGDAN